MEDGETVGLGWKRGVEFGKFLQVAERRERREEKAEKQRKNTLSCREVCCCVVWL